MKTKNDEKAVEIVARYEYQRRLEDAAKYNRELADKELRDYYNRKWKSAVTQRVRTLCRKNSRGNDRHWWVSKIYVHPDIDHSKSPWTVKAYIKVSVGLYIHTESEVARDELEVSFSADEIKVALARLGRMMAAGLGEDNTGRQVRRESKQENS